MRSGGRLRAFRKGGSGNVSIVFALSLVPMIGLVGLGIDYGMALSTKAKLDNAADAAALSAVATAKAYVANHQNEPNLSANAVAAGKDRAMRAFTVNAGPLPFANTPTPIINLTSSGQTFSSSVSYQTSSRNNFGQIFNQSSTAVGGSSAASADIPSYLDFYLLIDVSGSMGLPSTSQGQALLANKNGGCQFACHFPPSPYGGNGFSIATANKIQLRSGAVNTAVCGLLALAGTPSVPNQYRVGLYPFINMMATLSPLTSNMDLLNIAADCSSTPPMEFTNLLDTGATALAVNNDPRTGTGNGGTHFETLFPAVKSIVSSFGTGASASQPKPFIFLITDGMANWQYFAAVQGGTYYFPGNVQAPQWKSYPASNWIGGSNPQTINPTVCQSLKDAGATISILYIPYTTLVDNGQNSGETNQVNGLIPKLPTTLTKCASDGFFTTANTPDDINTALAKMFAQAIQVTHLLK